MAALFAWQAMRSAALSSRWIVVVHSAELASANSQIARLSSKQPRLLAGPETDESQIRMQMLERLGHDEGPRMAWVGILIAGFGLIASGLAVLGMRGVGIQAPLRWRPMRLGIVLTAAGAAAWIVALWQA